jgi:hypothetical protein
MQALGTGAVQINVQATYQGQVVQAAVTQTNYATVADAAKVGRTPSTPKQIPGAPGSAAGSLAGTVAGLAGAGLTAGLVVRNAAVDSGCTLSNNMFLTDLSAARDACIVSSTSPQCTSAAQTASSSLGEWCACDGAQNVDTALRMIGTSLQELTTAAGLAGTSIPASCSL